MSRTEDPDREIARELRLRGDPPVVARLSRRSLALLAGVAGVAIAAVVGWSLMDHPRSAPPPAAPDPDVAAPPPPELAALPKDYVAPAKDAPRLGPPLPGDLGRPILRAGEASSDAKAAPGPAAEDPQLRQAELEARQARGSRLAVTTAVRATPPTTAATRTDPSPPPPPSERYVLQAGTVIRAALITGIRSDLPGPVLAQVTEDVFDSATGRWTLIPQGARLIGAYDDKVQFGQDRLQVVWTRLVLPDARSVELEKAPATDAAGQAGLTDQVHRHWRKLLGAAVVSSALAMGAQAGAGRSGSELADAVRAGAAMTANQAGQQLVGRTLDTSPSIAVRPGYPVRLLVTRDLSLEAWRP